MAAAAFAASVAVAAPAAVAEQVYYCSSELATGIAKDARTSQWDTFPFENIRFTMKFGEMTKGDDIFQNRDLVVSKHGLPDNIICSHHTDTEFYQCVETSSPDIAGFFADAPGPYGTDFRSSFLITNLVRFEYYRGIPFGFVKEGRADSAMYAGTCETF